MPIFAILSHTPIWIWFLLAYLLLRGIRALQPSEVPWYRALILPVIFLAWALYGMFTELPDWPVALAAFVIALAAGVIGGWINANRIPAARLDSVTGLLWRPGSAATLVLVIVAFISKYVLSVVLAMYPHLGAKAQFVALFGGVSGLVDGALWGRMAQQFRQAFYPHVASA
ncbi:hypothetical protein C798_20090 [Herbaspirillum rubrisubalbicans Os34]|uniref:DUF1453 domain-containing protein n=1 Tax=Herbaspirillum rubrisubalbicans Os34 TaxID=1235827 RepID=A0A6M3ZV46_9BURK|nr:DUF6622 family protein [Herbaspirillum rubrisubalbicans]QJQ02448.1 hypothetical protein C798_20090 [Herbaspirillum rubrisubalbicans Os34]